MESQSSYARTIKGLIILLCSGNLLGADNPESQLKAAIAPLVELLPMQIDEYTSLSTILVTRPKTLIYSYTVDFDKLVAVSAKQNGTDVDTVIRSALKNFGSVQAWTRACGDQYLLPLYINANCSTPAPRRLIDDGARLNHVARDTHGNFLYEALITSETCASEKSEPPYIRPEDRPAPIQGRLNPSPAQEIISCEYKAVMTNEELKACGISPKE